MITPGAGVVKVCGQDNLPGKRWLRLSWLPGLAVRLGIPLFFMTARWTSADASSSARRQNAPRRICSKGKSIDRRERKEHKELQDGNESGITQKTSREEWSEHLTPQPEGFVPIFVLSAFFAVDARHL